ncbi:DNA translocase FtsK [Lacticaseibacillus mingshuiensis]|uniref:DNA translocase FtsK n=1 Tax=Lacticaseibacillus mingshuiensis TaxID=2799574 RepID=UPI001941F13B|nr:DNA translocase FtsK [Lacticaseibacillus mingshuiensis]
MAHYDGPAFGRKPISPAKFDDANDDYELPPRQQHPTARPQKEPVANTKPAAHTPTTTETTQTEARPGAALARTMPMSAFTTPASLVDRAQRVKIDYSALLTRLERPDDAVFFLATEADDEEAAVESEIVSVEVVASDDDTPDDSALPTVDEVATDQDEALVDADSEAEDARGATPEPNLDAETISDTTSESQTDSEIAADQLDSETADVEENAADSADMEAPEVEVEPTNEAADGEPAISTDEAETTDLTTSIDEATPASAEAQISDEDASPRHSDQDETAPAPTGSAHTYVAATLTEMMDQTRRHPEKRATTTATQAASREERSLLPDRRAVSQQVQAYLAKKKAAPTSGASTTETVTAQPTATQSSSAVPETPVSPTDVTAPQPVLSHPSANGLGDTEAPATAQAQPAPYEFPSLDLLDPVATGDEEAQETWAVNQMGQLDKTLAAFNVDAHVVDKTIGPTVTQFQVAVGPGVKVNKITNLTDDLKRALAARDIRIEAPIPGKTTVGIEIPNLHPRPVMLREVLQSPVFQDARSPLTVALGVDLFGQPVVTDLGRMPHGLIAGATGSGKSVFINSILTSLLYKATPQQVRLLLIDPKAVELAVYNGLPHLVSPVISDPKAAAAALKWAVQEMDDRYKKLEAARVRNLKQFNEKAAAHGDYGLQLPYLVIVIDELADLMMVASSEVQDYIARITAKARAAGIHLLVATQRPSVDVITGTIKNNIPTRIAFMVASQVDSRTIIDTAGAERLLGKGDMLYLGSGASQARRLQGTFIDQAIDDVVGFVKQQAPVHYDFQPETLLHKSEAAADQDPLMPQVMAYLVDQQEVSTSKLQRVFSIGYNHAAKLIDELERRHFVSPANASKPRDVYLTQEDLARLSDQ